jgi:hypothetical protein
MPPAVREVLAGLSSLEENLLLLLSDQQRFVDPGHPVSLYRLAQGGEMNESACWEALTRLADRGLVHAFNGGPGFSYNNAAVLTDDGREATNALMVPEPLGAVAEFSNGLTVEQLTALDAVTEQELRFGETTVLMSDIRTRIRKQHPSLDAVAASGVVATLCGSFLLAERESHRVTLRGLLASSWGLNALHMIDRTLASLRTLLSETPSLRHYSWRTLRNAARVPEKAKNLAYVSLKLANLTNGRGMVADGWSVPSDLDILLDRAGSASEYVRQLIDASETPPSEPMARGMSAKPAPPVAGTKARATMTPCKILFLASNPMPTGRLTLDEEARDIEVKIRAADYRESVTFRTRWAVRTDDLLQALNEDRPTIVHFSGHGSGAPGIVLHDATGGSKLVTAEALRHLFTALKDDIRVVVLNACYSTEQARAIADVIDCVIGMNDSVGDEAARKFAASFYRALGFGRSVKNAFDQGIAAIKLDGLADDQTPELLVRPGVNAEEVVIIADP